MPLKSAFDKVDDARAALDEGRKVLLKEADDARLAGNDTLGTQLDFCEGCLIDLERALTETHPPDPDPAAKKPGVNDGC